MRKTCPHMRNRQKNCASRIGARLDVANAVRELSKVADGANHAHWKALLRTIKYVICTENLDLRLKPNILTQGAQFHLSGISDSDYARDKNTRTSVFGYVNTILLWSTNSLEI
jgi:hypothetical protein